MTDEELDNALCGRCLVIRDARSSVRAYEGTDWSGGGVASAPSRDVRSLRKWVAEQIWCEGRRIAIDAQPDAFRCVATFNGDPVCVSHLWELRELEVRSTWSRRNA